MDWVKKVKELGNKMYVTQMELGKMLGVSFSTVNKWEMGMHESTMKMKRKLSILFKENGIKEEN